MCLLCLHYLNIFFQRNSYSNNMNLRNAHPHIPGSLMNVMSLRCKNQVCIIIKCFINMAQKYSMYVLCTVSFLQQSCLFQSILYWKTPVQRCIIMANGAKAAKATKNRSQTDLTLACHQLSSEASGREWLALE